MLHAVVLGSAAGGGFPQWNSNAPACRRARQGDAAALARSQASIAVSANERDWFVLNATPDLRLQIEGTHKLHPREGLRSSPIAGVVVTGGDVDAIAGLLHLRERHHFDLYAPSQVLAVIAANPIFGVLHAGLVRRDEVALGVRFPLPGGLEAELFSVPGKVALYLEDEAPALAAETGANVGVEIICGANRLAYVPGAAAVPAALRERLAGADVILFDATLFSDNEMIATGIGEKTGRRMGHMPLDGADGTLVALAGLPGRRILTHINNTNPILIEGSLQRRQVEAAGFEIAEDGMEIVL